MPNAQRSLEPVTIPFWSSGFISNRSLLAPALANIGIQIIQKHDMLADGINIELTDQLTLRRRPPFVKYCSQQLAVGETVNQFYSVRDLSGNVTVLADTNQNLYTVTPSALTSILTKGTANQAFVQQVGNMTYIADGVDLVKRDNLGNVTPWGIAAPTVAPVLTNGGFWKPQIVYAANSALLDTNGNIEQLLSGGGSYSGIITPEWPVATLCKTQDGGLSWQNDGPVGSWTPSTAYVLPAVVLDSNGNLQVSTGGTSGSSAPSWATAVAATTSDNTITWTNFGHGSPIASVGYSWRYAYRTIYGHLSTSSQPSPSSGPILGAQRVQIASFAISNNVVTFQGTNNFVVGDQFTVQGMSQGTYLNEQIFTVLSASLTTSAFAANFTNANVASTNDTGYTLNVIATIKGEGVTNSLCNATASVTSVAVTNNVVTCLAANSFVPGLWVTLTGFFGASFLNNQQVQISSANASQFTFQFTAANYGPTPDSGTATFNAVEVYRNADGGGIWYFAGAVTNPAATAYDSGATVAGAGADDGVPGGNVWSNPSNVTSASSYATVAVPNGSGAQAFNVVRTGSAIAQYAAGSNTSASETPTSAANVLGSLSATLYKAWSFTGVSGSASVNANTQLGTQYAYWENCGFSIPSNATIIGIQAQVGVSTNLSGGVASDLLVQLLDGGSPVGSDLHNGAFWSTSTTTQTYGGSNNLWGQSAGYWTPAKINASGFGLLYQAAVNGSNNPTVCRANPTSLTVYYTTPGGAPTSCTANLTVTAGDDLLILVQAVDGISSVSAGGNTVTLLKASPSANVAVYGVSAAAGGSTNITANFTGTNGGMLIVAEVNGITSSGGNIVIDTSANASASAFGSLNSGAVTTGNATDVILTCLMAQGAAPSGNPTPSLTIPSSYTNISSVGAIQGSNTGYAAQMAFITESSTGTYNSTWTSSNGVDNSNIHVYGITVAFESTTGGISDGLNATTFGFNVPFGTISGIKASFDAFATSAASCNFKVQLMRNGTPVGNAKTVSCPSSNATLTLGSNSDLWGTTWNYFNFNNANFGLKIIGNNGDASSRTFEVRHVQIEIFGITQTWTFSDATPDINLVTELIAPIANANDPPPGAMGSTVTTGGTILAYWNDRLWMAVGNRVYFTGGPDTLNGIPEECFNPDYFFTFPGNVSGMKAQQGGLVVAVPDTLWAILGGPQTVAFYPDKYLSHIGVPSANCLAQDRDTLLAYTGGAQLLAVNGGGGAPNEIGFAVGNVLAKGFGTNTVTATQFAPGVSSITVHRDGYDQGIWISNGVDTLLRYGLNVGNWSTPYQPLLDTHARAGIISSVETAQNTWTLLLSSNQPHDYIYQRQFTGSGFQDNGNAYDAATIVGNIVLSEVGLVPVTFISLICANLGSVPTVKFLPNEISDAVTAFTTLPIAQNDPAFLAQSQSVIAKRWPLLANAGNGGSLPTPLLLRHLQAKIDFGTDTAPNELFRLVLRNEEEQLS